MVPAGFILGISLVAMIFSLRQVREGEGRRRRRKGSLENLTDNKQHSIDFVEKCENKSKKEQCLE